MTTTYYKSLIGLIRITGTAAGIVTVDFVEEESSESAAIPDCLQVCVQQLDEYFQGTRTRFTVELTPQGTEFQQRAWQQLQMIPYGDTASYHHIAAALGIPNGSQAVGRANSANPIAILIPCHRIIGNTGKLTGYAGGLWRKEWLLRHEGALMV